MHLATKLLADSILAAFFENLLHIPLPALSIHLVCVRSLNIQVGLKKSALANCGSSKPSLAFEDETAVKNTASILAF